jgi:hypothetical protein
VADAKRHIRWVTVRTAAVVIVCLVSWFVPPLSVVAVVLTLVGTVSLPPLQPSQRRFAYAGLIAGGIIATAALFRFVATAAMKGIVEGGERAAEDSALWKLREVLIAEDGMRKSAFIDPDADHIGSAELINGLAGNQPMRTGHVLDAPLLNYRFRERIDTALGPAIHVGTHLYIVCLPRPNGGFSTRPDEPVDEEGAERRFVAYAWPADGVKGIDTVFFLDEHERILYLDSPRQPYRGASAPPPCEAAIGASAAQWKPWKNKKPRRTLPGDHAP